ncbi:MAG TPA: DinB family protein [Chitinophagaceae bacterium]|nr:DinB family protein [Chitinophagaceae bacterium]
MKKLMLLPLLALLAFTVSVVTPLDQKERKFAKELLKDTQKDFFKATKGLSEAQLKFKAAPDRWSVEDCMKHIAGAEGGLWQMIEANLKQPANPEMRSEIKVTDEQLIKMVEDRTQKAQAPEQLRPENIPFKTAEEAAASFKTNREKLIDFVMNTQDDMRGHVIDFPVGKMDAYQLVLLIGAHSNRHTQQIREVMADPNFPKQ